MEDPEAVISKPLNNEHTTYVKKEVDLRKYFEDFDEDSYTGTISTLPEEQSFFHVSAIPIGSGATPGTTKISIRVTYQSEFFDPQTPSSS